MDPTTVIIILAMHLVCSGALLYLIGLQMPRGGGLGPWSAGAMLFGAAYVGRLVGGLEGNQGWRLMLDTTMVGAALLFISGLRRFVGRKPAPWWRPVLILVAFVAVEVLATLEAGPRGRHAVLNITLGVIYGLLSLNAGRAVADQAPALGPPLRVVTLVIGVLAALAVYRGVHIALHGTNAAYTGLQSQLFYAYASLAAVVLAMTLLWMVFVRLNGQLSDLASRDALTRVLNRNGLDEVVARHFAARPSIALTLLQADLDHFKRVNDKHGHATGDAVLKAVAAALEKHVRGSDFVARVGGEEFIVGCVGGTPADASALAERLCEAVRAIEVPVDGGGVVRCTTSIGVSHPALTQGEFSRAWEEADRALYAAKAAGRDRVMTAS